MNAIINGVTVELSLEEESAILNAWSIPTPEPPLVVSPRQIRQALTATGMRAAVEVGVAAADQDTQDWWEFATSFEEDHPMIATMATALGITDTQRHDIFVLAASL